MKRDLVVMYEHPDWHQPLFDALTNRNIQFEKFDLTRGVYGENDLPKASLYYNMVSPSAYKRGHQRAIPLAWSMCRKLESEGIRVLNGSFSMSIEMSKSAQVSLLKELGIAHPDSFVFNHIDALSLRKKEIPFPAIMKPEQGGSGARMYLVNSWEEIEEILATDETIWFPDNLLLVQEKIQYDRRDGIIRMEFLGGEFLYAMRVITHDTFNLCPSLVCNPLDGEGNCEIPVATKPEFYPYEGISKEMIETGRCIMRAAHHDSGSIEYCVDGRGREIIYDINANSNLREPIALHFGIKPFERVVDFLLSELCNVPGDNGVKNE